MGERTDKTGGRMKQTTGSKTGNGKLERGGNRDEARGRARGTAYATGDQAGNAKKSAKPTRK